VFVDGEVYEILKTVKNVVIKKSLDKSEEPHKPHNDAEKKIELACDVTTHTNFV